MATVNKRLKKPLAMVINGVDAGGKMTARIEAGFDEQLQSDPDGLEVALRDKTAQYVRGTVVTQDWVHAVELLTGTVGTYVFSERKSGVAAATGFVKHTITNPVIHKFTININKAGYATVSFSFECRAADETKTIADMWAMTDDQAAPDYVSAARGGWRVVTTVHGSTSIYHVTGFTFSIAMNLVKESNDADVAYTCVDAELENMACSGSINFQDSTIAANALLIQTLVLAANATLVMTVKQSQGAASKVVTIAGVDFGSASEDANVNSPFTGFSLDFNIANAIGTLLTLAGANKIITIA